MTQITFIGFLLALIPSLHVIALGREWSDPTGHFRVDAELVGSSGDTAVLKKRNGGMLAVQIAQLKPEDQEFIAGKRIEDEAKASATPESIGELQTWTSRDGFELRGRVVSFGSKQIEIKRTRGFISVNGTAFTNLNLFYQHIVPKVVAEFVDSSVKDEKDLERWLKANQGDPPPLNVEGVLLRLEDGSDLAVPFFLFSEKDLEVLRPGWEQWKEAQASEADRNREDFLMRSQADSYQRQRQRQQNNEASSHQIQMMQLELLAANAGLTTIWEVLMRPNNGLYSRITSVVVSARNSAQAEQIALQKYPGFLTVGIQAVSR